MPAIFSKIGHFSSNCYYYCMGHLLKSQVKKETDNIKHRMLAGLAFEKPLYGLYERLRTQRQHAWTVQVYRLLLLYANAGQKRALFHPALLQAFMALGQARQARAVAKQLLAKNPADPETRKLLRGLSARAENALPPYTALAALSPYASGGKKPSSRACKTPLPAKWKKAPDIFSDENLQKLGYFEKRKQLARAPRACRSALKETFDELTASCLLGNYRAAAAMAGAMLEMLLALHIKKSLKTQKISVSDRSPQNIFDLNLHDLAACCAAYNLLSPHTLKLIGAARGQRNFIHPGKALLEQAGLTPAGARVCLLAVLETSDEVL